MQTILLFFLILTAPGVLAAARYRRRFEETLPLSMMGIGVIVFLFGIGGRLLWGVYAAGLIAGLCYLLFAAALIANRKRLGAFCKDFCRAYLSPGFAVFTLLFFVYFIATAGQKSWQLDDFIHWARNVKAMSMGDDFTTNAAIRVRFASYPPGYSLIQYFVQKLNSLLHPGTVYEESLIFFAYHVYWTAFFLPLFRRTSYRQIGLLLAMLCLVICLPLIFYWWMFTAVYADVILGIAAGCGFAVLAVRGREERDLPYYLYLFLLLFTLVLIKDVGLLFALFLWLAFVWNEHSLAMGSKKSRAALGLIALAAVALPKLLWSWELRSSGVERMFAAKLDFSVLLNGLLGRGDGYQRELLRNYIDAFFTRGITIGNADFAPSLYVIVLLELCLLYALLHYLCQKKAIENAQRRLFFWIPIGLTLLYTAGMYAAYLFNFREQEARELAGMTRYLGIPLLANGILISALAWQSLRLLQGGRKKALLLGFVCLLLLLSPQMEYQRVLLRTNAKESIQQRADHDAFSARLEPLLQKGELVVIYPDIRARHNTHLCITYNLFPAEVKQALIPIIKEGANQVEIDAWQQKLLAENDYVALYHLAEGFPKDHGNLFVQPEDIMEQSIYRVDKAAGKLIRVQE